MILPFSTQINGKNTYFVEKTQAGLVQEQRFKELNILDFEPENFDFDYFLNCIPKIHTIREDKNDRWKPGTKIDFFINCRQKNMFRFAPVLPVVSVQEVLIFWATKYMAIVEVDDKYLGNAIWDRSFLGMSCDPKVRELAQSDGFDSVEDFFRYFDKDFKGKIIHWTDLKY